MDREQPLSERANVIDIRTRKPVQVDNFYLMEGTMIERIASWQPKIDFDQYYQLLRTSEMDEDQVARLLNAVMDELALVKNLETDVQQENAPSLVQTVFLKHLLLYSSSRDFIERKHTRSGTPRGALSLFLQSNETFTDLIDNSYGPAVQAFIKNNPTLQQVRAVVKRTPMSYQQCQAFDAMEESILMSMYSQAIYKRYDASDPYWLALANHLTKMFL
jgi:hypothetical protein